MLRRLRKTSSLDWASRAVLAAVATALVSCSFLLDFPEEGTSGGGGGGGAQCEPLAVEACVAEASADASGCAAGTRTCAEDGSGFGVCACAALAWGDGFGSATGTARGTSVAVAPDGAVVVAGVFTGSINLGGATLTSAGAADLFVASFSSGGEHQWSQSFGNAGDQTIPPVVAVDSTGAVVLAGGFTGTLSFGGSDLVATSTFGNVFVAKLDALGAHVWSHVNGDRGAVTGVAIGNNDAIALAGVFQDGLDFGASNNLLNLGTENETFVARLDATGAGVWNVAQLTSDYDDTAALVRVGPSNETIVAGVFTGDFLGSDAVSLSSTSPAIYALSYAYDALNDDVIVSWAVQTGGTGSQTLAALAVDSKGAAILAGHYKGSLEAGTLPPLQSTDATEDLFLVKLDGAAGDALWSQGVTEAGATEPSGVTVDANDALTIVGSMNGAVDFGGGSLALTAGATEAAFLAKFDTSGAHVWSRTIGAVDALVSFTDISADRTTGELCVTGHLVGTVDLGKGPLTGTDDLLVAKLAP